MSQNELRMEIEVAGTPEEVWRAIATGPGISAWFMPAEVEEGRSITYHHGPDASSESSIAAWEPPRRLVVDEGEGAATEFLVEARSGGTCVVRLVASGFGDSSAEAGWTAALLGLRLYLEHFRGQTAGTIVAGGIVDGPAPSAWAELLAAVGIGEPAEGGRVATTDPPLAGVVAGRGETTATLLLDEPAPGIAFIGVGGPNEETVFAFLRAQLFGDDGEELAARDEPAWRARLAPLQVAGA
jgi:uncharacterized protein YndB with AHSA1/START domain